jgi:hypothetical protein
MSRRLAASSSVADRDVERSRRRAQVRRVTISHQVPPRLRVSLCDALVEALGSPRRSIAASWIVLRGLLQVDGTRTVLPKL